MMIKNKEEINNRIKLSIQVCLNGLSFCILNFNTNEVIWYKKTEFPKEYNPVKILEKIEEIYNSEDILDRKFTEVKVLFSHDLYSMVPKEFFLEDEASNYLKYNTKILKTDVVAHDDLKEQDLITVYIPFTNITNYLFDKHGEFEYVHSVSVLIESIFSHRPISGTTVYLNNYKTYFDLVVVKDNELLLSNSFNYDTKEDFIYYLLFTAEQLELDPSDFELKLMGEIDIDSPFYKIAYQYIKNISFIKLDLHLKPQEYNAEKFQQEAFLLIKSMQ